MVADIDVRPVVTEFLNAAEGEIIYAGGFYHVKEHIAGNQFLELEVVVDLGKKNLQKALGVEGLPLVHHPVVTRDDIREVVQELRILLKARDCVFEVLAFIRAYVTEIVFHAFLFHSPLHDDYSR